MTDYVFRRAGSGDLPLLNRWKTRPHVAAWWDDESFADEDLAEPGYRLWLVETRGAPFAALQDYVIHDHPDHHLAALPPGAIGIDLFIGASDLLDQGHGRGLVRQHVATAFAAGVPAVGTDPHPANARAIAAFRAAGFIEIGPALDTPWGRSLPMAVTR